VVEFDPEWLAITRAFYPLFSTQDHQPAFPEEEEARKNVADAFQWVVEHLQSVLLRIISYEFNNDFLQRMIQHERSPSVMFRRLCKRLIVLFLLHRVKE
jgi:hypothetical protein